MRVLSRSHTFLTVKSRVIISRIAGIGYKLIYIFLKYKVDYSRYGIRTILCRSSVTKNFDPFNRSSGNCAQVYARISPAPGSKYRNKGGRMATFPIHQYKGLVWPQSPQCT
ncbi:hypothetical protein D3C85_917330 [compost metagenome]